MKAFSYNNVPMYNKQHKFNINYQMRSTQFRH